MVRASSPPRPSPKRRARPSKQIQEIEVIFGTFGRIGGNALDKCKNLQKLT
ncbi:hypothetical protein PF011_g31200, partial [Phytophthora fragariae]